MPKKKLPYVLKEGERLEEDAIHHPPHFCPNCGQSLSRPISYWTDSHRPSTSDNPFKGVGYDCYCPDCHWSGDIIVDEDRIIVEKREEFVKFKSLKSFMEDLKSRKKKK